MLVWNVKLYDFNKQAIVDYNVLKYKEDIIKKLKNKSPDKQTFSRELEHEFRWRYWSRSEYELIIELIGGRVILSPWCSCREPAKAAIDATEDVSFDWLSFAEHHIDRQLYTDKAKIDVFNQLQWKWEELVDYCWYTRLPYERKHEKFTKE